MPLKSVPSLKGSWTEGMRTSSLLGDVDAASDAAHSGFGWGAGDWVDDQALLLAWRLAWLLAFGRRAVGILAGGDSPCINSSKSKSICYSVDLTWRWLRIRSSTPETTAVKRWTVVNPTGGRTGGWF
jgi:hypothetical protein